MKGIRYTKPVQHLLNWLSAVGREESILIDAEQDEQDKIYRVLYFY